jgi:molybdopterin-dependent oxidoreductase-like protein protein
VSTRLRFPSKPARWPHFTSPLRSTAVTARVGRVLGICFAICFVTGMLSHYQYQPWSWLPEPASPKFLYRVTQGTHVLTGTLCIPLILVKLWSVYPKLFQWPPVKSAKNGLERASITILVSSALVELTTGFLNALNWYPWSWSFVPVHRFLGYVVIGSILLHIAIKLPDIKYGLSAKLAQGDVLDELGWEQNPNAYSNNDNTHVDPPAPEGISRRGVFAATGAGVGIVLVASAGQSITPLEPVGLLAIRQQKKGPLGVPINRTAHQARVTTVGSDYSLAIKGPRSYSLTLAELEQMATHEAGFPISCVEGWSVGAHWRGVRLVDVVERAGGNADSRVRVTSMERRGSVDGPQVASGLLATHLNGKRITLDHGYPVRLICPDRAGVLNTKWLATVEIL